MIGTWNHRVEKIDATTTVELLRDSTACERCHHRIAFDETSKPGFLELVLDWQRVFNEPIRVGRNQAQDLIQAGKRSALDYFERVAEGGFDDK